MSGTVQLTVVVPFGKVAPDGGLQTTLTEQLPVAVTAKETRAEHFPGSVPVTILAGQVIVGFSTSFTVTANEQAAVLPTASLAVQLTVVVPFGNVAPDGGLQTTPMPEQLSVADALKTTTASHLPGSVLTAKLAGQGIRGASVSLTTTV